MSLRTLIQHVPYVVAAVLIAPTLAASEDDAGESATADDPSIEILEVQAHPLSGEGLAQAALALAGEDLEREVAANIGETVARQPGVHSAAFGEAVGRPVIHGMSGTRVRIMEDRIDTMDASVTSADHATTIDPFIANRVEVLKGPSTLLYGSGAIGGVVDVHTGRVPHESRERITGKVEVRGTDNGGRRSAAFRLDGGGESVAWHLDGFTRSADEYDIPGYAESARLRALEEHEEEEHEHEEEGEDHHEEDEHEDEHEHEEEAFGTLPGSQADGRGGAFGVSIVGDWGFAGVAVSTLRYDYGLPGGHHHHEEEEHDHDHEEEGEHHDEDEEAHEEEHHDEELHADEEGNVTLELEQTRVDLEAGIADPFESVTSLNVRVGINDYEHVEIEPNGEIGTVFENSAYEARVELVNQDNAGVDGAFGFQFGNREFAAAGEEAFVPPVDTGSFGAFWVGERAFEGFDIETGVRLDRVSHEPSAGASLDFTTFSASIGFVIPTGDGLIGLHGDYSSRAPIAEELYSNGPHLATQSFEVGDAGLDAETALNAAATFSWGSGRFDWTATAYATSFRDHIYQFATGDVDHGLLVVYYGQADAVYRGLDFSANARLADFDGGSLSGRFLFDTVAAELDVTGNDQLPRLPASRMGLGLELDRGRLTASLDFMRVFEQDEPGPQELPTDAYDDVRAYVGLDLGPNARLFLQGRNLTDEEQRQHTSYHQGVRAAARTNLGGGLQVGFLRAHWRTSSGHLTGSRRCQPPHSNNSKTKPTRSQRRSRTVVCAPSCGRDEPCPMPVASPSACHADAGPARGGTGGGPQGLVRGATQPRHQGDGSQGSRTGSDRRCMRGRR